MLKKTKFWFSLVVITVIIFGTSCNPTKKYEQEEEQKIQDFIIAHPEYNFDLKASGLYYFDATVGTGTAVTTHDTAFVMYTGKLLSGTVFDSNVESNDTLVFPLNEGAVITGFDEGVSYMKQGGSAVFLIPSYLAFGNYNYYIPPYTPVLFEVSLVKVKLSAGKK